MAHGWSITRAQATWRHSPLSPEPRGKLCGCPAGRGWPCFLGGALLPTSWPSCCLVLLSPGRRRKWRKQHSPALGHSPWPRGRVHSQPGVSAGAASEGEGLLGGVWRKRKECPGAEGAGLSLVHMCGSCWQLLGDGYCEPRGWKPRSSSVIWWPDCQISLYCAAEVAESP